VVELCPPRLSDASAQRLIRTRHHKQRSKTGRFVTDSEDYGTSDNDEGGRANDSDEEFTLGSRRQAAPRRQPPSRKSRSMM